MTDDLCRTDPAWPADRSAGLARRGGAGARGQSGARAAVSGALHLPGVHLLCPLTGQPDFAHIVIDYVPGYWIVESKSLKLFFASFRNHGAFHEACTMRIAQRLMESVAPVWLRVGGYWYPRGGMPIDVFWQSGTPPDGVWIPPQDVPAYRGRG